MTNPKSYDLKPETRIERISSLADVERYEAIAKLGIDGAVDDWYLEHLEYTLELGIIHGSATFKKILHLP